MLAALQSRPAGALDFYLRLVTVPDLVVLKLAAAGETRRRASKRSQDCTDVLKLVEEHPEVRATMPDVQDRVLQLVTKIVTANLDGEHRPGRRRQDARVTL